MRFRGASAFLHLELEAVGISLDEPAEPRPRSRQAQADAPVDRAEVRRILIRAGAPDRDLDWLTASCPSIGHADDYRPPVELPRTHRNKDPNR